MADIVSTGAPQKSKGWGCFFWGCLSVIFLIIIGLIVAYFGVKRFINQTVETYSATAPLELPAVNATPEEYKAARDKFEQFFKNFENNEGPKEISFTAREINSFIAHDPEWKPLKDKLLIEINNDQVGGKVSVPLEPFGFPGRYFNGDAAFNVSIQNGLLIVTAKKLVVGGKEVPEQYMNELGQRNLAADVYKDPKKMEQLQKIEKLTIQNGGITITRK